MTIKKINFFSFCILTTISNLLVNCSTFNKKPIHKLTDQYLVPASIKWDTLFSSDKTTIDLIHQNFNSIHFIDDSTLYIYMSDNEIDGDSILLAVDNVEAFKAKYFFLKDNLMSLRLKKIVSNHDFASIYDTIYVNRNFELFYKSIEFTPCNNLMRESISRLNLIEKDNNNR